MSGPDAPMTKDQALAWLVHHSPVVVDSYRAIGEDVFGWDKTKAWRVIQGWKRLGYVTTETTPNDGKMRIAVAPTAIPINVAGDEMNDTEREETSPPSSVSKGRSKLPVSAPNETSEPAVATVRTRDVAPSVAHAHVVAPPHRPLRSGSRGDGWNNWALLAAFVIAAVTAWASVNGMVVLFAGAPVFAMVLGCGVEFAKVVMCGWVGENYREEPLPISVVLCAFIIGCASLNAISVHSLLMNAHFASRGEITASIETRNAEASGRIEVQQGKIADIDKRLAQIDGAVAEATKRGKTKGAMSLAEDQRKQRAALSKEREQATQELANLKTQRVQTTAQGKASEEVSLRYLAETLGISGGAEAIMKFFAAAAVAVGDPFAIAILFAVGARRRRLGYA
jgi:hypothetical protein